MASFHGYEMCKIETPIRVNVLTSSYLSVDAFLYYPDYKMAVKKMQRKYFIDSLRDTSS